MYVGIGGFFRAHLTFPKEYPLLPPKMVFKSPIFHPNSTSLYLLSSEVDHSNADFEIVYSTGEVCISSISHLSPFLCLHAYNIHSTASPRRRQVRLRVCSGAMVTSTNARDNPAECYQYAQ